MHLPSTADTIVAVASGWQPAAVGIIRLSGPESFSLATQLGLRAPDAAARLPACEDQVFEFETGAPLPASVVWFRGPRSYSGQDIVEIHTVGCLPALRTLCARLIALGARRALPGEFTARAFLAGKLDAAQVGGVLALIHAVDAAGARSAARLRGRQRQHSLAALLERLTDLLASVEAGIDFVDEEDISFVTPAQVVHEIDALLTMINGLVQEDSRPLRRTAPHVALVGLANAGKSTLFNALLGHERAIVSPVLGTTRDVLSAELSIGGLPVVLQDSAGLGSAADEIELAAHNATDAAAEQADLVLWVHDSGADWGAQERAACQRIEPSRRVLVLSKRDQAAAESLAVPSAPPSEIEFIDSVCVSALTGRGLDDLQSRLVRRLSAQHAGDLATGDGSDLNIAMTSLRRARSLVTTSSSGAEAHLLLAPEFIALELRSACDALSAAGRGPLAEELLGRIFSQFCVGK